jgi:hypothetical protein
MFHRKENQGEIRMRTHWSHPPRRVRDSVPEHNVKQFRQFRQFRLTWRKSPSDGSAGETSAAGMSLIREVPAGVLIPAGVFKSYHSRRLP